ncbi:putative sulfurtransferase DsrE [compost metagenome]
MVTPQDELDLPKQWRAFVSDHQLDGVVCIAAALRRGVLNEEEARRYQREAVAVGAPWELSGLGQLHDAAQDADRLICFGGA